MHEDIVIHTLTKEYNRLFKLTEANMRLQLHTALDDIRMEQMNLLQKAMKLWKEHRQEN